MGHFQISWAKRLVTIAAFISTVACSKATEDLGGMNSINIVDEIGQATELVVPAVLAVKTLPATFISVRQQSLSHLRSRLGKTPTTMVNATATRSSKT